VKFQDETKKNPLVHPKVWGINPQSDNNGNKEKEGKMGAYAMVFCIAKRRVYKRFKMGLR
jgi:hypothetical protein